MAQLQTTKKYLALTLDPVHIGTGEFRLGRVDQTIVREAGTDLPKIPGSSLAGVTRAYLAMHTDRYPGCAGKGGEKGMKHCGRADCPVCVAFGFAKDKLSFQGLAQFSDARLLCFPVASLDGPVWITSPATLEDADYLEAGKAGAVDQALRSGTHWAVPLGDGLGNGTHVCLGWFRLPRKGAAEAGVTLKRSLAELFPLIAQRLVLVSEKVFGALVNDQLEVRTSVSIDPETGAAEDGALFTTEAIPRAALLFFQVAALNPQFFKVPGHAEINGDALDLHANVLRGLKSIEALGIGGANTRGMGRMRVTERAEG